MLQAAKLWEKTSAAGNRYLVGRLGGVRILILKNRDAGAEGEPDFHLFFADGSPREAADAPKPAAARRPARRSPYPRPAAAPRSDGPPLDDRLDDLWRGGP